MRQKTKLFPALGTVNSIKVYNFSDDEITDTVLDKCKNAVIDLHERWSYFSDKSEIYHINHNAAADSVKVKPDTISIIERAGYYKKLTNGAYDMTSGALYHLWKKALQNKTVPSYKEISSVRDKMTAIDLGGIAKGYAADLVKSILSMSGINSAVINLGGTVTVIGETQLIGIKNPFDTEKSLIGHIPLSNKSMITSGTYEQFFEYNGRRYHHIIDPRTGYPADTDIVSVSLIGDNATMLDALATGIIVMGMQKGLTLLLQNNIEAVIVTEDGTIYTTSALKKTFTFAKPSIAS